MSKVTARALLKLSDLIKDFGVVLYAEATQYKHLMRRGEQALMNIRTLVCDITLILAGFLNYTISMKCT